MFVNKLLLNGSTDFDEIFCVSSGGSIMVWTNNSVQLKLFISLISLIINIVVDFGMFYIEFGRLPYDRCIEYNILLITL